MFDPFASGDASVRVEKRQHAHSLPLPALMQAIKADPTLAAAVIEGGPAMSGLPADVFAAVEREARVQRATAVLAGQRQYATVATANDPIGGAVDHAAARADAESLLTALDAEAELLDTVKPLLGDTITAVALLLDINRNDAFAVLTA